MTLPAPKEDALVSLRRDVRELGAMLGEVIQSQGGTRLFERVEDVRRLSKSGREGETRALETLTAQLSALPSEEALQLARAFSHFLSLANIAEQHDRVRMSRQSHQDPELPAGRGSVEELMTTLLQEGITPERLFETVCALKMELVLTAHPTEITRRALLQKYLALDAALSENDRPDLPEEERVEIQARIRREIAAFWHTDEVMRQKPSPRQEAWGGLLIFEQSLWQALPQVLRELDRQVFKHTGQRIPLGVAPFTVGSWMGGDRDGNPNVTAKVTREVCWLSRWISADLYAREVSELIRELSMHRGTPELQKAAGGSAEPYRVVLREVEAKLGQNRKHLEELLHQGRTDTPLGYRNTEELREPLMLCYRSLCDSGLKVLAEGRLLDVLRRLDAFGLALVRLDLRQEASRHTDALDAVTRHLGLGSYAEWEEPRRVAFLSGELAQRRPLVPRTLLRLPPEDPALSPAAREVLETFALLAEIPAESLGAYVISMAVVPSDVLAVTLLLREFGVEPAPRVVPLFETVAALDAAGPIMDQLLSLPCYRERLGGLQEVMIGYSDSTKEAGRLASAWGLFRAQEAVVAACRKHQVQPVLFHGRGGSVGRGGGPTYQAVLSQPPGSVNGRLRVTEQGEMIQSKYGFPGLAQRSLRMYLIATLEATLQPGPRAPEQWRDWMGMLAQRSRMSFRAFIERPEFPEFFRKVTPEEELGLLNIGSRPQKRQASGGLETLRAIPWVFAWTQVRLMLPSWLGVGEALEEAFEAGWGEELGALYREWPFFRSTLDLVEMVLAKSEPEIFRSYNEILVPERLKPLGIELLEKLSRTRQLLLRITGHEAPLQDNPVLGHSIAVRNPYVDPLNVLQVELLRRLRGGDRDPVTRDALLVTINGIAAGMRNTG